jgi:hypothetical protein
MDFLTLKLLPFDMRVSTNSLVETKEGKLWYITSLEDIYSAREQNLTPIIPCGLSPTGALVMPAHEFDYNALVDSGLRDGDMFERELVTVYLHPSGRSKPYPDADCTGTEKRFTGKLIPADTQNVMHNHIADEIHKLYKLLPDCKLREHMAQWFEYAPVSKYSEDETRELCRFTYTLGRDDKSKSQAAGEYIDNFEKWFDNNKKK